nr:MAG TPA: large terminase [Caudoviricetes sp.]
MFVKRNRNMILFLNDWLDPANKGIDGDGPIADVDTRNKSFLDYASVLQQMGIKNWAFCLALHDPKLKGVDPFDENLSVEMKYRVGKELEANPWYYLREAALVPPPAGADPMMFRAHRANIGMFWLFMNNVSFFLLQPRQTGKSIVADVINNYLLHYRMFNSKTILVTLSQLLLSENIERIKLMRSLLPQYTIARTSNDTKAKEMYTYPARGNRLITKVSQSSEMAARNVGRGCTTPVQQYDEAAYINYMDEVYPAATAATGAARDIAKERGEPYGTMITTTAGDKMSRSGRFMYNIYQNSAPWTEKYMDLANNEELHSVIRKASRNDTSMVGATFNHRQLGFTDQWLMDRIRETQTTDVDKINRDYFNIWTSGSALSPLTPELTEAILASETDPKYLQITNEGYLVKWYIPREQVGTYMATNHCIIGADTSEAINRDATSFVVVNITTLETVAVISVSEAAVIKLADFLAEFMVAFRNTTLIIERRSTGSTFIETLCIKLPMHGIDPMRRIYNEIVQNKDKYPEEFKTINDGRAKRNQQFYDRIKSKIGFATTGERRHQLYKDVLQVAARRCKNIIYDRTLSGELRSLEVDSKTGRIDHSAEGHDDNVIAWLLALWLLMFGKNLSFYGIESRKVMMRVTDDGETVSDSDLREKRLIDDYQREILELTNKLADNTAGVYRASIEHRINLLNKRLQAFGVETKNIDTLIYEVRLNRQKMIEQNRQAA